MVDRGIIREWLSKAEEDFQFANINLKEKKPFFAQICFHFHQSAEKYLKAYIIANDLEFQKIHDLALLVKI
jgi:HEPN domain-containing protein